MQLLHNSADHFGNVIKLASYNVAVVSEAVVKRLHYISEMSQNYVCLKHRGVDYNLLAYTPHTLKLQNGEFQT
jgi:hypothetical protein